MTLTPLTIYGDSRSGNCHKVTMVADRLGIWYRWVECDVMTGITRTAGYLAMNPAGQVPFVQLEHGRFLAQSNAIMLHLADGSDLIPRDPYGRALMFQWLFWEQYSHEPVLAVRRFKKAFQGLSDEDIDPSLLTRGAAVLALMDTHLADRQYFVGDAISLADIALVAYTRLAHEGGFDVGSYPGVARWVGQVAADLRLAP